MMPTDSRLIAVSFAGGKEKKKNGGQKRNRLENRCVFHTDKPTSILTKSNLNQILFTIFRSILNQVEFCFLFKNQSENDKYNLISVDSTTSGTKFDCVHDIH